jgi:hypothetical protein
MKRAIAVNRLATDAADRAGARRGWAKALKNHHVVNNLAFYV